MRPMAKHKRKPLSTEEQPKFKKDGTPWVPWSEVVAERIKRHDERVHALAEKGEVEDRSQKCTAMTTGVHGPKRPCDRLRVRGLNVCYVHGGGTKAAKAAARQRIMEQLDPTITRLLEIRDQDDHLPSALGAATHLMNRALGKPDSVDKEKGSGAPIINIGIALGGLPVKAEVKVLHAETIDAEVDEDNESE